MQLKTQSVHENTEDWKLSIDFIFYEGGGKPGAPEPE